MMEHNQLFFSYICFIFVIVNACAATSNQVLISGFYRSSEMIGRAILLEYCKTQHIAVYRGSHREIPQKLVCG